MSFPFSSDRVECCSQDNPSTSFLPLLHFPGLIFSHMLLGEQRGPLFCWMVPYHHLRTLEKPSNKSLSFITINQEKKKQSCNFSTWSYKHCDIKRHVVQEHVYTKFRGPTDCFNHRNTKILIETSHFIGYLDNSFFKMLNWIKLISMILTAMSFYQMMLKDLTVLYQRLYTFILGSDHHQCLYVNYL